MEHFDPLFGLYVVKFIIQYEDYGQVPDPVKFIIQYEDYGQRFHCNTVSLLMLLNSARSKGLV
jgi:hypothetical protein